MGMNVICMPESQISGEEEGGGSESFGMEDILRKEKLSTGIHADEPVRNPGRSAAHRE